jgi:uncharacterized protein (UPF0332 family)
MNTLVEKWKNAGASNFRAAKMLYEAQEYRPCISRAYYAAYQAVTAIAIEHGDEKNFPADWNNPSHEQLPELVRNNGGLPKEVRKRISNALRDLRYSREDADYRMGRTVNKEAAMKALHQAFDIMERLGIET